MKVKVRPSCSSFPPGIICLLFIVLAVAGCGKKEDHTEPPPPPETARVKGMVTQIMTEHNKAMPLTTDIYLLKKKLKEKIQENPQRNSDLQPLVARMDSADHGMRVWMHEWSDVKTSGLPEEEILATLKIELEKVKKVNEEMHESVAAARAVE